MREKEAKAFFSLIFEVYFEGCQSHINGRLKARELNDGCKSVSQKES